MRTVQNSALRALRRAMGAENIDVSPEGRFAASHDSARFSVLPDAVVRPKTLAHIAAVLKCANRYKIPVTVRGGGSGMAGGAVPVCGGWALDLSGWKRLEISKAESFAYAQAGVVLRDLANAARAQGLYYPPDPSSIDYATVGGSISTNAGGLHCVKYGVTRDYVVALEGFLPTGEFVRWGRPLRKFAAGTNVRDLWIGAEGTLGVITRAVLKLVPLPPCKRTFLCAFKSDKDALCAAAPLLASGVRPSVLEYVDTLSARCAADFSGRSVFPEAGEGAVLLVEVDGARGEVAEQGAAVEVWARRHARAWRRARDERRTESLWQVRRKCSPAMFALGDAKLSEDVVVPLPRYGDFAKLLAALARQTRLPVPVFGHAGDGNFHVHFMYRAADAMQKRRAERGVEALLRGVVRLGGAISGEHGVGATKSPYLKWQHSDAEIAAFGALKRALDPNGILNPRKVLSPVRVADYPPLRAKLPWDNPAAARR